MTLLRLVLALAVLFSLPGSAESREARTVALIVSMGGESATADRFQAALRRIGAVTLRADGPSDPELRAQLRGFAAEAAAADVALAVLLVPVLRFGGRDFVAPAGLTLRRGSDLLTRSIPLSAFARAADLAGLGGAVLAAPQPMSDLPPETGMTDAPPPRADGVSPVLLVPPAALGGALAVLDQGVAEARVDLTAILAGMAGIDGVAVSYARDRPVLLREPGAAPVAAPAAEIPAPPQLTPELLAAFEASAPRALRRSVQRRLNVAGHYQGRIDGIFGAQTREAIRAWQAATGAEVTGWLTPAEFQSLQEPSAPMAQ